MKKNVTHKHFAAVPLTATRSKINASACFLPFLLALLLLGCQEDACKPAEPQMPYFTGSIGGSTYRFVAARIADVSEDPGQAYFNLTSGGKGSETLSGALDSTMMMHSSEIRGRQTEMGRISVTFIHYLVNQELVLLPNDPIRELRSEADFQHLLSKGAYPYEIAPNPLLNASIRIEYIDQQSNVWSSALTYNQDHTAIPNTNAKGGTFQVVESTEYPLRSTRSNLLQLIKVKFGCKVYNEQGDSLSIDNAEFLGVFEDRYSQ